MEQHFISNVGNELWISPSNARAIKRWHTSVAPPDCLRTWSVVSHAKVKVVTYTLSANRALIACLEVDTNRGAAQHNNAIAAFALLSARRAITRRSGT